MRICAGVHGGRKLTTPKSDAIRPTSDKIRQAVFNSLQSRNLIHEAVVLDAFCGTGALGLEALSQGASQVYFFDKNKTSLSLCKENISSLEEEERSFCLLQDTTKIKKRSDDLDKANLVFLDPPYQKNFIPLSIEALIKNNWLADNCFFVLETQKNETLESEYLEFLDQKIYGDTAVTFARRRL